MYTLPNSRDYTLYIDLQLIKTWVYIDMEFKK
jgi:hypothetical protein